MTRGSRAGRGGDAETALSRLSRPPGARLPDRAFHHGSRALLFLLLALSVTFFFPLSTGLQVSTYEVGMVADEDVIASISFGVPKTPEELQLERSSAASAVPLTFELQPEAADSMETDLGRFFEQLAAAAQAATPSEEADALLSSFGLTLSGAQRELLLEPDTLALIRDTALRAVRELMPEGVLSESGRLSPSSTGRILVKTIEGGERYMAQDSVLSSSQFYERATQFLPLDTGSEVNELLRLSLIRFMDPTLRYDAVSTEQDRNAARRAVAVLKANVLQGEAIVRANQQLGESEIERLRAYEEALRAQGELEDPGLRVSGLVGSVFLNLLVLSVLGFLLFFFRPDVYGNFRWMLLLGILIMSFSGTSGIIARNGLPAELLPIAFVSLAAAVLWDGRLALVLAAILTVIVGIQGPFQNVTAWLPVFVAGSAAALSVRAVRRRAQTWIFIAIIVGSYAAVLLALGLVTGRDPQLVATSLAWAGGNSVVSAILAMGFLPVFEWFTGITTDQTLLEWADPNRPLLKRLSMEAPGTYAHSINVANLAEAAANAIGANGLLCRVGVYYHDVGKILKPQYFIENQPAGRNPHDKLKPVTSAAIVREHVTEGIRLAEEAKLPQVLVDFIPEHHGTQEISFFYEKARQDVEDAEDELDPEAFRYPGPRPRSKETAVVMLADSVESATRTLKDPTPDRVMELIDSIVDSKIQRGQLEEAPVTLQEIGVMKRQFHKVLGGVYHSRIDYPQTRHLTESPASKSEDDEAKTRAASASDRAPSKQTGSPPQAREPASIDEEA